MSKTTQNKPNIIFAPSVIPLEPDTHRYFTVQKINCRDRTCMINTVNKNVLECIFKINSNLSQYNNHTLQFGSYLIHVDKFNNIWYTNGNNHNDEWHLIWQVFADGSGDFTFRNSAVDPWNILTYRQGDINNIVKNAQDWHTVSQPSDKA